MIQLDLPPFVGALSRRLHDAGVPMTPRRAADLALALTIVAPATRGRLYWTARALSVSDRTQVQAFDEVFVSVFGGLAADVPPGVEDEPAAPAAAKDRHRPGHERARGSLDEHGRSVRVGAPGACDEENEETELEVGLAMASDEEVLAAKRFDALAPHELAQLYRLMSRLSLAAPLRSMRRHERGRHGARIDMRGTLRGSLRTGGDPIRLARRARRSARRRLVVLCDISGSMEPYARAYLQFLTAAAGPNAEAFVFATQLTRVTRALASRSPERAIERAAAAAPDWSSGTRIGDALKAFNDHHGRRGMARGAVVVILSDGWERGDPGVVGLEMARLGRLAHRIVWVNPRVAASGFSVQVGGMVAALPHCDALVSGHSFNALHEVVEAIGGASRGRHYTRRGNSFAAAG